MTVTSDLFVRPPPLPPPPSPSPGDELECNSVLCHICRADQPPRWSPHLRQAGALVPARQTRTPERRCAHPGGPAGLSAEVACPAGGRAHAVQRLEFAGVCRHQRPEWHRGPGAAAGAAVTGMRQGGFPVPTPACSTATTGAELQTLAWRVLQSLTCGEVGPLFQNLHAARQPPLQPGLGRLCRGRSTARVRGAQQAVNMAFNRP
eukprot:360241-Chlamydomonas_euryale.AAC.3